MPGVRRDALSPAIAGCTGLGGIPQTMLGFYADTIREVPGIDPSPKLLFGISFGYGNESSPANAYRIGKAPLEESVTFHAR